jgi:hypothetical protein
MRRFTVARIVSAELCYHDPGVFLSIQIYDVMNAITSLLARLYFFLSQEPAIHLTEGSILKELKTARLIPQLLFSLFIYVLIKVTSLRSVLAHSYWTPTENAAISRFNSSITHLCYRVH